MIIIEDQTEPAEHHDIGVGLDTDTRQQLIVGLAGHREDGDLLTLDQGIEHVDHRHIGTDHLRREVAAHRVDRRAADVQLRVSRQVRARIQRLAVAAKNPAQDIGRIGHPHRVTEETDRRAGRQPLGSGKDLQRRDLAIQLDHPRQGAKTGRVLDQAEIIERYQLFVARADVRDLHLHDVANDLEDPGIVHQALCHEQQLLPLRLAGDTASPWADIWLPEIPSILSYPGMLGVFEPGCALSIGLSSAIDSASAAAPTTSGRSYRQVAVATAPVARTTAPRPLARPGSRMWANPKRTRY